MKILIACPFTQGVVCVEVSNDFIFVKWFLQNEVLPTFIQTWRRGVDVGTGSPEAPFVLNYTIGNYIQDLNIYNRDRRENFFRRP